MERAVRVLRALAADGDGRRLSDLSRQLGVSKSTLSGVLRTLEGFGFVERDPASQVFRLGFGVLDLADSVLRRLDLRQVARPYLVRLRDATGETAILHVPSGHGSLIIDRAEPDAQLKVVAPVGHRLPPFAGSVAKVLLAALPEQELETLVGHPLPAFTPRSITDPRRYRAELDRVRRDGYATEDEEYLPGVRAVTAPLVGRGRDTVGTLSVVGVSARLADEGMSRAVVEVVAAAAAVSRLLGGPSAPGGATEPATGIDR